MDRVVHIEPDDLEGWVRLSPQDRLRQANATFRLFHHLHRPFERPFVRGFDTLDEFFAFEKEHDLLR